MKLSVSQLRQDIHRVLDRILETGTPVEIERKGRLLRIVPVEAQEKLANLRTRSYLKVDPEEIVHVDWSVAWRS